MHFLRYNIWVVQGLAAVYKGIYTQRTYHPGRRWTFEEEVVFAWRFIYTNTPTHSYLEQEGDNQVILITLKSDGSPFSQYNTNEESKHTHTRNTPNTGEKR
jgi:hypothetical protein